MTPAAEYTSESAAVEAGLMGAILAVPEDDNPRLIYADWLDEHAVDAVCTDCHQGRRYGSDWINCPCRGTGRVSDGRRELAEFVRVQCELARLADCDHDKVNEVWLDGSCRVCPLRRRERELWTERLSDGYVRGYHWFTAPLGFSTTLDRFIDGGAHADRHGPGTPLGVVRRGFVSEVRCTLAAFVGGQPCRSCDGVGDDAGRAERYTVCPTCKGDPAFRTVGLAAELARRHPLTEVRLTDAEPWNGTSWYDAAQFLPANDEHPPSSIPSELFARLAGGYEPSARCRVYDEPKLAHAALGLAACRYARAAAGLTAPPPSAAAPAALGPPASAPPPGTRRPR